MSLVSRVKRFYNIDAMSADGASDDDLYQFRVNEALTPYETEITIPKKFQHVNLEAVYHSETRVEELVAVVKKVHPWSSLHYGISAVDVVRKLYIEWIPKYFGNSCEIQILSPMTRGSLGDPEPEPDDSGNSQSGKGRCPPAQGGGTDFPGGGPGDSPAQQL